ncbi:hypothetical protein QF037_001764 [Streptomyces canus]|uniref:DUF4132 domain-containing protein n=1 Tax=Streptomyces canus TaxID=58343 RepID=UPI002783FBED|nr:DUF4132 domain-containing protein [Streptomyces canus]MDQ0597419.1 hypothetical protein [Streptomyces canus]
MLYDSLVAEARRNDPFDDVRAGALARARWLVDLLERQRAEFGSVVHGPGPHEQYEARLAVTRAEIDAGLAACGDEEGRAAVLSLMLAASFGDTLWQYESEIGSLVSRVRGWTPAEVAVMLLRSAEYDMGFWFADALGSALTAAEELDAENLRTLVPWLRWAHTELLDTEIGSGAASLARRLRALLAIVDGAEIPDGLIPEQAPWAAPLRARAVAAPSAELAGLIRHLTDLTAPRPTQRWRRRCLAAVEAASARDLVAETLRALAKGEPLCSRERGRQTAWEYGDHHYHYLVHQNDGDLARGTVWAAALTAGPAAVPCLDALALRTGAARPTGVVEDLKLAGAAINALAEIDDPAALESLWRLRSRIRHRGLRKQLDTALTAAAGRQGITPEQLVERSVPDHGLAADGSLEREVGGHRVRVEIEDATTVRIGFTAPDGRTSRTAPAGLKDGFPEALKELKDLVREVRGTLAGERGRLEALMSAAREWPYDAWCRHYRDHPVTGVLVRGLIWEFQGADGEWHAVAPAARPDGRPERVRLWHPIRASVDEIGAWRERIVGERLRQPFKQAFRELYLLTPAEEETGVYSNRFAAHIVHYRQLYALFKERGWQSNFLGHYDGGRYGEARAEFADGRWRVCFHHEPADDGGHDIERAATDQVRFERRDGRRWRETPLADVEPLVFSEAMRDIDLFVGVTSIAADPEWSDRGESRHAAYWRRAGFGDLTASAEVRREALERILPRLKIADRCAIAGRWLSVRGDLRTYRIHLGSANILMEPDDSYLCIVPARRGAEGKVFLPFEDDRLSLILSKAQLLAADTKISDETILRQIRRGG